VNVPKNAKAHQRYKLASGEICPGVTTVIDELGWNKNALIAWARREALAGNDPNKIKENSADIGTCAHYLCECDAKGIIPDLSIYSQAHIDIAENCYIGYLDWKKAYGITKITSEIQYVSEQYKYGGQIDLLCEGNGRVILGDIKTSSGIYAEHRIQVAGYHNLAIESGVHIDDVFILHLKKNGEFAPYKVANLPLYFEVFKHCLAIYNLHKEIKR